MKQRKKNIIEAYIETNMSLKSFSISIDWRDKSETPDVDDFHGLYLGKNHFYTLSKRTITGKFNIDEVESEVQSIVKMIKEKHPNVQVIGQFDCIKTLKDYFNGLC